MRFTSTILASAILFASSEFAVAEKGKRTLFKDDQSYWNRVLNKGYPAGSMPTAPPTERPTTAFPTETPATSEPSAPPTLPGPCVVDVDTTCALDSDLTGNTSCETLSDVTELQCTGCPPVALCFTFTAAPCPPADELPPGLNSCNDFNGGPQVMADITISSGMKMFVDGTFMAGAEVCVSDNGAELPAELMVFINTPMGGMTPTPNQLSIIDSTCSGQGLTLLTSYGSLNLVHYINSCQGDNDCFVPITYTHKVTNDGPVGLTITELDRTLNNVELDLIAGVDPASLRLEEGEMFIKEDPVVAECCMGVGLDISTTVVAMGDDGSVCNDNDAVDIDKPIATGLPTPSPTPATPEPSSPPSSGPTPGPTTGPSPEPSSSPSSPPSPGPTPEPSSSPSSPPSPGPTPAPSTGPTPATPEPSSSPSSPPSPGPTPAPSAGPTASTPEPSPSPSSPPSPEPTPGPSLVPSPSPSSTPSGVPTPGPTTFPPGDLCFVQVNVGCTPPPGFTDCDSLTPPRDECLQMVFTLGFRYQGGDCSRSFNIQDPQIFQCESFQGGPPTSGDAANHFIVTDIKGLGINYFTGDLQLGDDFVMSNGGAPTLLGANVNVTIYESVDNISPSGILQTMVIHTSCSQVTFLKDTYGAIQLLSFNNTLQGFRSCMVDVSFTPSIANVLENTGAFTAILESLVSFTSFDSSNGPNVGDDGILNYTDAVAGVLLAPGDVIELPATVITLDLAMRKLYTIFSTVQGASPDGFSCQDSNLTSFTAATTLIGPPGLNLTDLIP